MTYRELLEAVIKDMTDEELADLIFQEDIRNMAIYDRTLKGDNIRDRILDLLKREVEY